jgi:hypothetical protein
VTIIDKSLSHSCALVNVSLKRTPILNKTTLTTVEGILSVLTIYDHDEELSAEVTHATMMKSCHTFKESTVL